MGKTIRFSWESVPNLQIKILHTDIQFPRLPMTHGTGEFFQSDLEKMSPEAIKLGNEILAIPGVTEVWARRYEISITKGKVFHWEEILPKVLAAVQSNLCPDDTMTSIGDCSARRLGEYSED